MSNRPALPSPEVPEDAITFAILQEKAEEYKKSPLVRHYDAELGAAMYLKPLTGAQMESAQRLAGDHDEEVPKYMIIHAVQTPSFGLLEYNTLNQLNPGIKARLLKAIRDCSGMQDNALELGKFDFGIMGGKSSGGTDSLANSAQTASASAKPTSPTPSS